MRGDFISPLSPLERLNRFKLIDPNTGCWRFTGSLNKGYGQINIEGKIIKAHKLAAIIFLDYDPNGDLQVNHKCKNRDCWNPEHLYIGTQLENVQDMRDPEHFNCGHLRTKDNSLLKIKANGYAMYRCRECQLTSQRRTYYKNKRKREECQNG